MKFKHSIIFMALLAITSMFASCSEGDYWDEYIEKAEKYSFACSASNYSVSAADVPSEIKVEVYRNTTTGSVVLPLTITGATDVLNAPASISFEDGSAVAELVFTVAGSPEIGVKYTATAKIGDENVSVSGNGSVAVTLLINYIWNEWTTGTFTENFNGFQTNVKIMKADGAKAYRIMQPYKEFFMSEYGYSEAEWAAYSCPYIEFTVDGSAVSFQTFMVDTYDGTNMIYGYLPSDLAASVASYDALSKLIDKQTVQIVPYYYVPGVGGWGVDYPIYLQIGGSYEF